MVSVQALPDWPFTFSNFSVSSSSILQITARFTGRGKVSAVSTASVVAFIQTNDHCIAVFCFLNSLDHNILFICLNEGIACRKVSAFVFFHCCLIWIIQYICLSNCIPFSSTFVRCNGPGEAVVLFICIRVRIYCGFQHGKSDLSVVDIASIFTVVEYTDTVAVLTDIDPFMCTYLESCEIPGCIVMGWTCYIAVLDS